MPSLQLYPVETNDNLRPIVIIAPGGGYTMLADCDRDRIALQYNAAGFHAAVLNYSVEPHHFPEPQQNLMSAIRLVREHAGNEDEEKLKLVSCDEQVSKYTSPTFLYNTFEDKLTNVENVLYYAENLKKHEIPFEMHIFPKGGHGESWCDSTIWVTPMRNRDYNYIRLSIEWMRELFGLMEAK